MRFYCVPLFLLTSCSANMPALNLPTFVINPDVEFSDKTSDSRLEISLTNEYDFPICLSSHDWPDPAGGIERASNETSVISLVISGTVYPIRDDYNAGYCLGGCATKVGSGEIINSHLYYKDFYLPRSQYFSKKVLIFSPIATKCE